MKLKQIVVSIENAPGRLFEVTNALGNAGINLRALNLVDTGAFGQLRLLVSDVAKARPKASAKATTETIAVRVIHIVKITSRESIGIPEGIVLK